MRRRERALASLFPEDVLVKNQDYPSRITIPDYIHQRNQEVIPVTESDGAERAINYYYFGGRWRGSKLCKGTARTINSDGTLSGAGVNNIMVLRPHLRMHTHPSVDVDMCAESIELAASLRAWDEETANAELYGRLLYYEAVLHLPSYYDVHNALSRSSGVIGNLIVSKNATFAYMRKKVRSIELPFPDTEASIALTGLKSLRSSIERKQPELDTAKSVCLNAVVDSLDSKYACYMTEDPENPSLDRV